MFEVRLQTYWDDAEYELLLVKEGGRLCTAVMWLEVCCAQHT